MDRWIDRCTGIEAECRSTSIELVTASEIDGLWMCAVGIAKVTYACHSVGCARDSKLEEGC